jgi:ring-1,2-phenylacetyl-CoA epoxidase subunit PaaD
MVTPPHAARPRDEAVAAAAITGARADAADVVARAWAALAGVPDPEIPMVSVVELGIVRTLRVEAGGVVVEATPTYSGCPATDVIFSDIVAALSAAGIASPRVELRLAPAWTTDWIAPEAKRNLRAFGIAPPPGRDASGAGVHPVDVSGLSRSRRRGAVPCPRCGSANTVLLSQFGSTACKAQYRCGDCLEPFDYFKPH